MPVSKKIKEEMTKGSWIRRMFEEGLKLKRQYGPENVFDLSLGNPDLEPPESFKEALKDLANLPTKKMHNYMPNAGYEETRSVIASIINRESKTNLSAADIVMTCGAAGGLNVVLKSLLDTGKEVIIFTPYFVEYIYYIDNHNLRCKIVETDNNFIPDTTALEDAITKDTGAVLINSPNNPTGAVYDETVIKNISAILKEKQEKFGSNIILILDDAYHKLTYDGINTPCIFNYYHNSVIVSSFSKTLSVAGERIGYIAINPASADYTETLGALAFCNRTLGYVNAPAMMQNALKKSADKIVDVSIYKQRRDYIYKGLVDIGFEVAKPSGAFYIFPKTPIADDVAFTTALLKERVLAVPGSGFGRRGYMRLAYCVEDFVLKGAIDGLKKVFSEVI